MISNLFKSGKKKKSKENIQTNNKNQTKKKKEDFYIKNNVSMVDKLLGKAYLLLEKNNINLEKEKVRESSQDTIQYEKMLPSGICKIDNDTYSKTIEFFDINYQLAQNDDKNRIFESYCEFLNYFDSTISFQLLFVNKRSDLLDLKENIIIEDKKDEFDDIRQEYTTMLKNQLERGNNGIIKNKYITFSIKADNLKSAKQRLEKIESDILNNFKVIGARAKSLNGQERLKLMHGMLNLNQEDKFVFSWDMVKSGGMSTKDIIAPPNFNFDRKIFRMGDYFATINYMIIDAPEMSDRLLAELLDIEEGISISFNIQSIDQNVAIKRIKQKRTDLDAMKIDYQKKAVRAGYDMDILPSDLQTYTKEAEEMLNALQQRNERMFNTTVIILSYAKTRKQLDDNVLQIKSILQKSNCTLKSLDYQMERAINSILPIGKNQIDQSRMLTTTSTAIFVPFTTQELFMPGGLYYGLNAISNNMIMVDRKELKNPNGLILGQPGGGKSFSSKREIVNCFLVTDDDIMVCDPENEYAPLVKELKGQVINLSPTSKHYINPLDISMDYGANEDGSFDDPIVLKSDFIISLCELIVAKKTGLEPIDKTVIDRCVRKIYQPYMANPIPENIPILEDLYKELLNQEEKEAKTIATGLELYVTGSLNVFNHHTNVDIDNRFVCYNLKDLGKQLKKIGMLIVQDQVWNKVAKNRGKKSTRYYIDEIHLLLIEKQTAEYSVEIWKRFRKWGGIPTGLTQNVKDLLSSSEIENIFENSEFMYLLSQGSGDREILAEKLKISPHQLSYITNGEPGEGLIVYGNVTIPFIDNFPNDTKLYKLMSTKPKEILT